MNNNLFHNDTEWTLENYKNGLILARFYIDKQNKQISPITDSKIKSFPIKEWVPFFSKLRNNEFELLPFRVFPQAENSAAASLTSRSDIRLHTFTLSSKYAYMTMFCFEMSDLKVDIKPFIQISLERFYSKKKGYGIRLLKHLIKNAKQLNVVLTVWCENEKLKDYYINHGFKYCYQSETTGHYFMIFK